MVSKTSKDACSAAFQETFSSAYKSKIFFSIYPASHVNIWPLIFIHNVRTFCPLVESEQSCQTANYENMYLWQGYYYTQQNYFTELLEQETVSQQTWISSQMSSSKRVAAVWCCRGAIRQWPSVRDWLLGRDKYTLEKQTKTQVSSFPALETFPLLNSSQQKPLGTNYSQVLAILELFKRAH